MNKFNCKVIGRRLLSNGVPAVLISLIAIFVVMLALNIMTPLWGDDWWRALDANNFAEMFQRIGKEYMSWTGRVSVLFLTFLFLLKYPGSVLLFNVVSSLVFCCLNVVIFRAATGRLPGKHRADFVLLLLIFFCIWFFTQAFGESVLWKTGAIAYMWVITAAVFLLIPYVELIGNKKVLENTRMRLWGLPVFAFFWALALENVAITCFLFMLYSIVASYLGQVRVPRWYWHVLVAQLAGTILLIAAPGNFVRFDAQDDGNPIWLRLGELVEKVWHHGTSEIHVFIAIAVVLIALATFRQKFVLTRFYFWAIIAFMLAMTMVGSTGVNFGDRTAFVAEVCFVIALTNLLYLALCQIQPLYIYPLPSFVLIFAIWGADFIKVFDQYLTTWHQTQRREELMVEYKDHGVERILLPSMTIPFISGLRDDIVDHRYFLRDIHPDTPGNGWRNSTYAGYHGFKFANRVTKADIIYEPEIENRERFKNIGKIGVFEIYQKRETRGFESYDVLYLFSTDTACRAVKTLQVHPEDVEMLPRKLRNKAFFDVKADTDVMWVSANAKEDRNKCVVRFKLPAFAIEKVEFSHNSLPWPHKASLFWMKGQNESKPAMTTSVLEWKACKLNHAVNAIVDTRRCSVSSGNKKIDGFLTWGPYAKLEEGKYLLLAEYSAEKPGAHWHLVAQMNGGPKVLAVGVVSDVGADRHVIKAFFDIDKKTQNELLEFRVQADQTHKLTLYRLAFEKEVLE